MTRDLPEVDTTSWASAVEGAWRSSEWRRAFEEEAGFEPLADFGALRKVQGASGYSADYFSMFSQWVTWKLDLTDPRLERTLRRMEAMARKLNRATRFQLVTEVVAIIAWTLLAFTIVWGW